MFDKAIAVTPSNGKNQKNILYVYRQKTKSLCNAVLHIACADFYQVYVNGVFVAAGPARTAKNYAREDILNLNGFNEENNEIEIFVAAYNCRSLSNVLQNTFLIAEISVNGKAEYYTGKHFELFIAKEKLQKTSRYSFQRHFTEVWDLGQCTSQPIKYEKTVNPPTVLSRRAPYPKYEDIMLDKCVSGGSFTYDAEIPVKKYLSHDISTRWGCFSDEEIMYNPCAFVQRCKQTKTHETLPLPVDLKTNQYAVFDFGEIETGFITFDLQCKADADIIIAFTENFDRSCFCYNDMNVNNATEYLLKSNIRYSRVSFEPYTAQRIAVFVKSGCVTLNSIGIKTYECDLNNVKNPVTDNSGIAAVYTAAMRTFAHNAVDIYTDCPSRERAGWLCDSYFTAAAEYELFGKTDIEDDFLENYILCVPDEKIPKGMLPMCYPAELEDSEQFIPQWPMWLILEIEEYINIRKGFWPKERFKPLIDGLINFYSKYENEDGLLENLPSWNFVEWSKANDWTKDVNYPTNFLYAEVLDRVYKIFGDESLKIRSETVRKNAVSQSFDGRLFYDHSVRDSQGNLVLQSDCSETAQYYAALFGNIDLTEPKFKVFSEFLFDTFNKRTNIPENIEEINAFIGLYLRLIVLCNNKKFDMALSEIKSFFGPMQEKTNTLWENRSCRASLDHGFASYALVLINKSVKNK